MADKMADRRTTRTKAIALTEFTEWTWQTEVRSQKPEFFAGRLCPDLGPWTWNVGYLTLLAGRSLPRRPNFSPKPSLSAMAFLPAMVSTTAEAESLKPLLAG